MVYRNLSYVEPQRLPVAAFGATAESSPLIFMQNNILSCLFFHTITRTFCKNSSLFSVHETHLYRHPQLSELALHAFFTPSNYVLQGPVSNPSYLTMRFVHYSGWTFLSYRLRASKTLQILLTHCIIYLYFLSQPMCYSPPNFSFCRPGPSVHTN